MDYIFVKKNNHNKYISDYQLSKLLVGNKKNIIDKDNSSYQFFNQSISKNELNKKINSNIDIILPLDENSYTKAIELNTFDNIDKINFYIGSELIESIDGSNIEILQYIYKIDNKKIPFGIFNNGLLFGNTYHQIKINISARNNSIYNIKFYKYVMYNDNPGAYSMKILQYSKNKLFHPIRHIVVKNKYSNLFLKFIINNDIYKYCLSNEYIIGNYLIFTFNDIIDMSNCSDYFVVDDTDTKVNDVFYIYSNLLLKMSGMSGLRFN